MDISELKQFYEQQHKFCSAKKYAAMWQFDYVARIAKDIITIHDLLSSNIPFCYLRFGEGELKIMKGYHEEVKSRGWQGREYGYDKEDTETPRLLIDAIKYKSDNYIIGINYWIEKGKGLNLNWDQILEWSEQKPGNVICACIFAAMNYPLVELLWLPLLRKKKIVMVCSHDANTDNLGLDIKEVIRVNFDAMTKDLHLLSEMKDRFDNETILLAAGPFSCILGKIIYEQNPNTQIIDVGSALDKHFYGAATRNYLKFFDK